MNAFYDKGRKYILDGGLNYPADTVKCALVSSGYTPNLATHQFMSDIGANIVGVAQPLGTKTDAAGTADAEDVTFPSVAGGSTVNYLVIYKDIGGIAASSPLIALYDTATGLPLVTDGTDIGIEWSVSGLFKV